MPHEDEFEHRYRAAKKQFNAVKSDHRELYLFLFNGREREFDTLAKQHEEPEEIYDSTASDTNLDFTSDLFSFMVPENQQWVDYQLGSAIPEELEDKIAEAIEVYKAQVDKAIRSSNFYDVGLEVFQDFGVGTAAMWVDRTNISDAISVDPVPLSELRLSSGIRGVEDRFREKRCWARDLPILFRDAEFSKDLTRKIEKVDATVPVIWGFWRDYSDPGNPIWVHTAKADGETIIDRERLGPDGNCPLLVGRFNPQPGLPYGRGPGWKLLPDLRTIDALRRMVMEKMDQSLDPAFTYFRDGLLDLSEGIEAGMGYPTQSSAKDAVQVINTEGNLEYGLFSLERLEEKIRRGYYRKREQPGKTPPSASQFIGEEQEEIRRMWRPAAPVFAELIASFLRRVEVLEVEAGMLPEQITVNETLVTIRPISPMMRALSREKVIAAQSIMGIAGETFGQQTALLIDGTATMTNIKNELGDELVVFRTPDQLKEILQLTAQATGQGQADA